MIADSTVVKRDIRRHYQLASPFYRLFWGPHIHHGLWQADETPAEATNNLTDTLARLANLERGQRVLDVGCGLGGSSIRLAQRHGADVTGVTVSGVQRRWASWSARWHGQSARTRFLEIDAEQMEFPQASFDVLWSIECTEHLFDKAGFFQRAVPWLAPGGRVAICAWLAGSDLDAGQEEQVAEVCRAFLCPSLATFEDYCGWFEAAGLERREVLDWTPQVLRTWEICAQRTQRSRIRRVAGAIDLKMVHFLDRFEAILEAYHNGAMRYGCFVFAVPESPAA